MFPTGDKIPHFFKVVDDEIFVFFQFKKKVIQNYPFLAHLFGVADDKYWHSNTKTCSSVLKSRLKATEDWRSGSRTLKV